MAEHILEEGLAEMYEKQKYQNYHGNGLLQ
jgi:hypothetical protein